MSPAHVLEPTYDAIKRRLSDAYWPMGTKLEAVKLADDLGVSITPVRDSLNRLFGEHLVDFIPGEGFRVPVMAESHLRDLFNLQRILLSAAVETRDSPVPVVSRSERTLPDYAAHLFLLIAARPANEILTACVASINDRLHLARSVEHEIFHDVDHELAQIANGCKSGNTARAMLKGLIAQYYDRRIASTSLYVRHLSAR